MVYGDSSIGEIIAHQAADEFVLIFITAVCEWDRDWRTS